MMRESAEDEDFVFVWKKGHCTLYDETQWNAVKIDMTIDPRIKFEVEQKVPYAVCGDTRVRDTMQMILGHPKLRDEFLEYIAPDVVKGPNLKDFMEKVQTEMVQLVIEKEADVF